MSVFWPILAAVNLMLVTGLGFGEILLHPTRFDVTFWIVSTFLANLLVTLLTIDKWLSLKEEE